MGSTMGGAKQKTPASLIRVENIIGHG
jgi:hypothetical protein